MTIRERVGEDGNDRYHIMPPIIDHKMYVGYIKIEEGGRKVERKVRERERGEGEREGERRGIRLLLKILICCLKS